MAGVEVKTHYTTYVRDADDKWIPKRIPMMPPTDELDAMLSERKQAPEYKLRWKPFYERYPNWREMISD